MTPKQTKVTINYLLEQAKEDSKMMLIEGVNRNYTEASYYQTRLEGMIEAVEVLDCGSVGGFGKGQEYDKCLLKRLIWLQTKYKEGC